MIPPSARSPSPLATASTSTSSASGGPGERLLIRWQALTVTGGQNDGVALQAITVS
ncbi:hypothetical protein V2I01_21105 [Micromonospora sp. BRA006-A]|nr:hypothetical protein [Micromonospora sp. BRA006-A]